MNVSLREDMFLRMKEVQLLPELNRIPEHRVSDMLRLYHHEPNVHPMLKLKLQSFEYCLMLCGKQTLY